VKELINLAEKKGVILRGHFVLSSGKHSGTYVQKDLLSCDVISILRIFVSEVLWIHHENNENEPKEQKIDTVVSVDGARSFGLLVAQKLGVDFIYGEKIPGSKEFAFRPHFLPFLKDKTILIAEDVLTTGGSLKRLINACKIARVFLIDSIFLMWNTDPDFSYFRDPLSHSTKIPIYSAVTKSYSKYKEEDCPMCKERIPITRLKI